MEGEQLALSNPVRESTAGTDAGSGTWSILPGFHMIGVWKYAIHFSMSGQTSGVNSEFQGTGPQ